MGKGTTKAKKEAPMTPEERLKREIAAELGLLEKVEAHGWGALSASETGRVGGLMTKRRREGG
jgi:small acid-soluble spore protein F (minor alpha/beta-type SASP)